MLRNLPENTIAIGRIRKDAKLFLSPIQERSPRRGRRRWYGAPLPTPEQLRQDDAFAWQTVQIFGAGKTHKFDVKTIAPVRWLGTGATNVGLVVVRPLAYQPRKGARLLYGLSAALIRITST